MTVYVDDMRAPFGRMLMCHMQADTTEELNAMATAIGISHRWIQNPGTHWEHYDICLSKKGRAIKLGAVAVTQMELGRIRRAARLAAEGPK